MTRPHLDQPRSGYVSGITTVAARTALRGRTITIRPNLSRIPAEVIHGNQDRRVLGVKGGEIKVVMTPNQDR